MCCALFTRRGARLSLPQHMSIFADKTRIKSLLQEYMRRIVLHRPADPVSFLLSEISEVRRPKVPPSFAIFTLIFFGLVQHPFSPDTNPVHVDARSDAQKRAWLDTRPVHVKVELLRKLFNEYADKSGNLNRGKFLVRYSSFVSLSKGPNILHSVVLGGTSRQSNTPGRGFPATREGHSMVIYFNISLPLPVDERLFIFRCVETLPATREGLVTWSDFSQAAVKCLSLPGSSTN